jgi:hypothetical protein
MAIARTGTELRRWRDLAVIRRAIAEQMPELNGRAGLGDVAELCRRHALARPGRDWNDVRDDVLTIACEWDLANDRLDTQSDRCLDCLARFLKGQPSGLR